MDDYVFGDDPKGSMKPLIWAGLYLFGLFILFNMA